MVLLWLHTDRRCWKDNVSTNPGRTINVARQRTGMTWSELAEEVGISVAGLRRIRNGEVQPKFRTLRSLETALQMPPTSLDSVFHDVSDLPAPAPAATQPRPDYLLRLTGGTHLLIKISNPAIDTLPPEALDSFCDQVTTYANYVVDQLRRDDSEETL